MLFIKSHCNLPDKDIGDIKSQFISISSSMENSGKESIELKVENENQQISRENKELRERVVECQSQTRSMRDSFYF